MGAAESCCKEACAPCARPEGPGPWALADTDPEGPDADEGEDSQPVTGLAGALSRAAGGSLACPPSQSNKLCKISRLQNLQHLEVDKEIGFCACEKGKGKKEAPRWAPSLEKQSAGAENSRNEFQS